MSHAEKVQPFEKQDAARNARLDNDTVQYGTVGPFDPWESDHTALVHILWDAKHNGLSLEADYDKLASMIMRSRWLAANRSTPTP